MVNDLDMKKEVAAFVGIVFLLLGVLFGMQIMTFIFGNLGPAASGLDAGSAAFNTSTAVQNNSLGAIETYTNQSNTQFNTAAIAITLLILIAIFAIFWKIFMSGKSGMASGGGGNFG